MQFTVGFEPVSVNVPAKAVLLAQVRERLGRHAGFAVATLNLDHLVKLAVLPDFARAYARHELVVADGRPVVWLARLAGYRVELVPGSDLIMPLCGIARDLGARVALVGSTQEILQKAAARIALAFPGIEICETIAPSRNFDPDGEEAGRIIAELDAAGVQLCLLALGAPKQECLAARARAILPGVGFVSIGAGLDFIAGHQRRAPRWMRVLALEWLWRAMQDPRRMIPRYAQCLRILPGLVAMALRMRLGQLRKA